MPRFQTSLPSINSQPISDTPTQARGFHSDNSYRYTGKEKTRQPSAMVYQRGAPANFRSSSLTIGSTLVTVRGANPMRCYLMLQNLGTVDIWVSFGGVASLTGQDSVKLAPNAVWTFEAGMVGINELTAVASTSASLHLTEGSYIQ